MSEILEDVRAERNRQIEMWGNDFDDAHNINDWVAFITLYAGRAVYINNSPEDTREALVKVAALAVAALEALERNGAFEQRHYEVEVE